MEQVSCNRHVWFSAIDRLLLCYTVNDEVAIYILIRQFCPVVYVDRLLYCTTVVYSALTATSKGIQWHLSCRQIVGNISNTLCYPRSTGFWMDGEWAWSVCMSD